MTSVRTVTGSALRPNRLLRLIRASLALSTALLVNRWSRVARADSPAVAPTAVELIERPTARGSTVVDYPPGGAGDSKVELELSISKVGVVTHVEVLRGDEPFATQAREAALTWLFKPARRGGREVAARTRATVEFTQPGPQPTSPGAAPRAASAWPGSASPAPSSALPPPAVPAASAQPPPAEIVVNGVRTTAASVTFTREEVRGLPGAFGDPFRAVEIMPGVTPTTSGHPYFYVRGAPPGNVGYYVDDIPLPVLYHAVNGPAILQPAFIDSVTLFPGAYSARYGRYAGAVVAGQLAPPELKLRGEASVRLYDAGGLIETPFANGHGSLMAGGRYSYSGALVSHFSPNVTFGYWDYQARAQYDAGKGRVTVFALGAHDFLSLKKSEGVNTLIDTTFHRVDLRYSYAIDSRSAALVAFTFGRDAGQGPSEGIRLHANQYRLRTTLTRHFSTDASLRVGADVELDAFGYSTSATYDAQALDDFLRVGGSHQLGVGGAWLELAGKVSDRVTLLPGVRFDFYHEQTETKASIEPRITARYRVSKHAVITNSAGLARQPPSRQQPTPGYRPRLAGPLQTGIQTGAGLELQLPGAALVSVNVFQTVLLNGADFDGVEALAQNARVDAEDTRTRGHSVGAEFVVSRSLTERFGGFLSYTLSRAWRTVGNVEGPSGFDRTHVLSGAVSYDFGRGWRSGVRGTFYTGIPVHVGIVSVAQHPPRTPPFWRIDARFEKRWHLASGASIALVLEVLNATLNDEVVSSSCYAYGCKEDIIGPITLPSIGVEAAL